MSEILTNEKFQEMKTASHLLPDPGGEVVRELITEIERLRDSEELAWVIIANANEGDWSKATDTWREAAARWRDNYHKHLSPPTGDKVEEPLGAEEKV
jgi:hypothetical protein